MARRHGRRRGGSIACRVARARVRFDPVGGYLGGAAWARPAAGASAARSPGRWRLGSPAMMKRLAAGDTSAPSRHPSARRDRRNGAHRDRVPRHHDRARAARRRPGRASRTKQRSETMQPSSGSSAPRSNRRSGGCGGRRAAWKMPRAVSTTPPTRFRRKPATPRSVETRVRQRHGGGGSVEELAVSIGEIASQAAQIDRVAGRAVPNRAAPSTPCRNSAAPPTVSAKWSA